MNFRTGDTVKAILSKDDDYYYLNNTISEILEIKKFSSDLADLEKFKKLPKYLITIKNVEYLNFSEHELMLVCSECFSSQCKTLRKN